MKRPALMVLFVVELVCLTGCASMLNREYSSVTPHANQYWENGDADTLRAEDYQSLVNDLLVLVDAHTESGVVRMYDYGDEPSVTADLDSACVEIKLEDPLGSYAVDYMTYTVSQGRTYYEAAITINYRVDKAAVEGLVNTTTSDAIGGLVAEAIVEGKSGVTVHVSYMNTDAEAVMAAVESAFEASGKSKEFGISYYPDEGALGDTRIIDISWDKGSEAENAT